MFVKMPELRIKQFESYANEVSDGITAVNHYFDGHHAFTMYRFGSDEPGITNYKLLVSEYYYQQFMLFLYYYGLDFYSPTYRQFIIRL